MKKTIASILATLVLLLAIPAVLVFASPEGLSFLSADPTTDPSIGPTSDPTSEPTVAPTDEPTSGPTPGITAQPTEGTGPADPTVTPEPSRCPNATTTPPALERVRSAHSLGIPPGRLLHIDRLAKVLGWTRERTWTRYRDTSIQDLMKLTNQLRHSGQGRHPIVTPLPSPVPTLEPTATPTREVPAV